MVISSKHLDYFYIWLIALLMLSLAKIYETMYPVFQHHEAKICLKYVQRAIHDFNSKAHASLRKMEPILQNTPEGMLAEQLSSLTSKYDPPLHILVCNQRQLLYWNFDQSIYDPGWCQPSQEDSTQYAVIEHGGQYFIGMRKRVEGESDVVHVILYQKLTLPKHQKEPLLISFDKTPMTPHSLVSPTGKPLAYLKDYGRHLSPVIGNIIIFYYLLVILIFYYPFHHYAKEFFRESNYAWALLCLITGVLTTASMSQWIVHEHQFYHSILTDTVIKTHLYSYTLFEFVILCGFMFHLTYFFYKYFPAHKLHTSRWSALAIATTNYLATLFSLIVYCFVFKAVFVHSDFYLNLDNVFGFEVKHYVLLGSLLLMLLSIFLISNKLCVSTLTFGLAIQERLAIFGTSMALTLIIYPMFNLDIEPFIFIIAASIIVWMQDYFAEDFQKNILWLIAWIIVISILSSGLIFHYQNIDHRYKKTELVDAFSKSVESKDHLAVNYLITHTIGAGYDLYLFDHKILRYASNANKPSYQYAQQKLQNKDRVHFVHSNKEWLVAKQGENYLVIISHPLQSSIKAISLFSYLFTLLILVSYFLSLIHNSYPILPEGLQIHLKEKPSLRNRIQFYIILGIVLSFLIIAVVTVFFTKKNEQAIMEQTLYSKTKNLIRFLEASIVDQPHKENAIIILKTQLKQISQTEDYFVQLFDANGQEINYLEYKWNPLTKIRLADPQFVFAHSSNFEDVYIQTKNVGHKMGLSAFQNLFFQNERIGIVRLQTIEQPSSASNRLANLVNTLLNIYVFLFLIAASMATFLSNSITAPLEALGNKLREIRLGKSNEQLQWSGQDEIGELIQNYNSMVSQLDESAKLIAKTERDLAWREMAKQVAHEIKNPLTPMKLSIQYLQQAIKSGSADITSMTKQVTETLIEQIDNLTKIASEFSNFAKMPQAENEKLILNEIISSVHDLFRKRDDIDITLSVPIDEIYVFADKNQLIRVLNNLINNAIQAIPQNRRGKIEIMLRSNDRIAQICVKDNGVGIPDELRNKVFLPNFTSKSSGTGLGLAMCQQIIENANGKIYFTTELNVGSQFFVEIPLMRT